MGLADRPFRQRPPARLRRSRAEGNHYFPPDSVNREYLRESDYHTTCPWKGLASYYDVVVDGKANKNAAWYYPAPKEAAKHITGYVAFWRGVAVQ